MPQNFYPLGLWQGGRYRKKGHQKGGKTTRTGRSTWASRCSPARPRYPSRSRL